jgi:nucleotide-binding universal stress UspA family protein
MFTDIRHSRRDAMKSILLPVDQNEQMPSAFATARLAADIFESTIEGIALAPVFSEIVAADPMVAIAMPPSDWSEVEFGRTVRQAFDTYATQHSRGSNVDARFRWRGGSAIQDAALGSLARVYDVTVLNRPGNHGGRMSTLEYALFDSGRPVLMAPPAPPKSLGQTIAIHWNASTEVSRAIAMAIPMLRKAKRVIVLSVEGSMVPGPSAKDAVQHLELHGIGATEKKVGSRGQKPGAVLLAEARALDADLLIKGTYTQSRFRQMIFGGATQHVLAAAELPVFLAH